MRLAKFISLAVTAGLASGCAVTPAEDDPMVLQMENLERRLDAIERILANGSLVELTLQMDDMQRQSAAQQGRIDQIEYEQSGSGERQRALYADLDERIQGLESTLQQVIMAGGAGLTPDGEAAETGASLGLPVPGGTDQANYQAAFELLKEQQYEQAAAAFGQFLVSYPDSQLADNAQYWLAESYYVTDDFSRALAEFQVVIDRHPRSRKVPDALLKIGYCNYELERWPEAKVALSEVQASFPDTTAARLADQRLKRMTDEGR